MNKKNVEFGLTFRKERVKGQFCDVTITFYNDDMSTKIIYRYKFFKKYSLSEAEDMFWKYDERYSHFSLMLYKSSLNNCLLNVKMEKTFGCLKNKHYLWDVIKKAKEI